MLLLANLPTAALKLSLLLPLTTLLLEALQHECQPPAAGAPARLSADPSPLSAVAVIAARVLLGALSVLTAKWLAPQAHDGEFLSQQQAAAALLEAINSFYSTVFHSSRQGPLCAELFDVSRLLYL